MSEYKGGGVAALERDLYHAQFSLPPLQLQVLIGITTIIITTIIITTTVLTTITNIIRRGIIHSTILQHRF